MSMDGLSLYACLAEIRPLIGGKIDKVQQPEKDALLLTVRAAGRTSRLLISVHAENGRIQLTEQTYQNPPEPPAFCMLLRRRLVGARIESIEQLGLDRYVVFSLGARSELDDPIELRLAVELMGRNSNVTLIQNGVVVDALRHVTPAMSTLRILMPGARFTDPPAQQKRSLLDADDAALTALLAQPSPARALQAEYAGLSRAASAALIGEAENAHPLCRTIRELRDGRFAPSIAFDCDGNPVAVFPFSPVQAFARVEAASSMSAAYDRFFEKRDARVRIERRSAALRRSLETQLRRAENKLAVYREAILGEAQCEQYRLYGELITANLHRICRGQSVLAAENYYLDPPERCSIALDPLLSPTENAQRYFKQYRKSKAARAYAERMRGSVEEEIAYLDGQLDNIEKCSTLQELTEIREELVQLGYQKPERRGIKPQKQLPSSPAVFVSSDGVRIFVGKNNRQNDQLTLHRAASDNLWLHVKDIPGSHVIVDFAGMPPDNTLREAAMLAAYFSKAQHSASVPVDYALRKYVKKPSGAKPGMVIYTNNQTLYVTPEAAAVRALEPTTEKENFPCV